MRRAVTLALIPPFAGSGKNRACEGRSVQVRVERVAKVQVLALKSPKERVLDKFLKKMYNSHIMASLIIHIIIILIIKLTFLYNNNINNKTNVLI